MSDIKRKIRILQFPIASTYGGITHYALNNWYMMDKTKFECDFATMSPYLDFADDVKSTGANIHYISCYPSQDENKFREEFSKILDYGYDVVHLHTKQWKDFTIEELCKKKGIRKVIVHSHNAQCDTEDEDKRSKEIAVHNAMREKFTVDMATDFWACSRVAADWLFGSQIPRDKIRIMHNAIDVDKFLFNEKIRNDKRKELGIADNIFVIGNVARLSYSKNQELLIRAYAKAFGDDYNHKLLIAGDGPLRKDIEELIKKLGLYGRVKLLGFRDDINELYQAFDLYAQSSRFEGLSITLIEAQTSGLRCLINRTIPEEAEITDGCIRVNNDEISWAEALRKSSSAYIRNNIKKKIMKEGYDIRKEIEIIQSEYER